MKKRNKWRKSARLYCNCSLKKQDSSTRKWSIFTLLQYLAFEELRDEKQFIQFGLDQTIFWKNGADIAPEYLYNHGFAIA